MTGEWTEAIAVPARQRNRPAGSRGEDPTGRRRRLASNLREFRTPDQRELAERSAAWAAMNAFMLAPILFERFAFFAAPATTGFRRGMVTVWGMATVVLAADWTWMAAGPPGRTEPGIPPFSATLRWIRGIEMASRFGCSD